jgi:hypothetical protein
MISVKFDDSTFFKEMKNVINYSEGFLDGAQKGKTQFLESIAKTAIESLKQYVDSNARLNPQALHHVYEWSMTGSPASRLFDLSYSVKGGGLTINSTFNQSISVRSGSKEPFYDKARIMENGVPVTIKPKSAKVLAFEDNGEKVFTKNPIEISNPGGQEVQGSYQRVFDQFFNVYFSQIFLRSSGIMNYLEKPAIYKDKLSAGKTGGRPVGLAAGYKWISQAGDVS